MENMSRAKVLSLFLSGMLLYLHVAGADELCQVPLSTPPQSQFSNLRDAATSLQTAAEEFKKANLVSWLPGLGENFKSDPTLDFKKGRFYAPIDTLLPLRKELIALSYQKMLVINGAQFVFGVFIPDSYFGNVKKLERAFPEDVHVTEEILGKQPYLLWDEQTGSVSFKTQKLRETLLERYNKVLQGKPLKVYRGQIELDAVLIQLLRAIGSARMDEAKAKRAKMIEILNKPAKYPLTTPEIVKEISKISDPKAFAESVLKKVRRAPYLFVTPTESWASHFTFGGGQVDSYLIDLANLAPDVRSHLHIGADSNGSPPAKIEIALPFWNVETAVKSALELAP